MCQVTQVSVNKFSACIYDFWLWLSFLRECLCRLYVDLRLVILFLKHMSFDWDCLLWQYRLWGFSKGDTKSERFLPKNQHNERKLLNFEFWINGELSKSAKQKFYFQSQFSMSKIIRMFRNFFSLKSTSLLLAFFDKTNF